MRVRRGCRYRCRAPKQGGDAERRWQSGAQKGSEDCWWRRQVAGRVRVAAAVRAHPVVPIAPPLHPQHRRPRAMFSMPRERRARWTARRQRRRRWVAGRVNRRGRASAAVRPWTAARRSAAVTVVQTPLQCCHCHSMRAWARCVRQDQPAAGVYYWRPIRAGRTPPRQRERRGPSVLARCASAVTVVVAHRYERESECCALLFSTILVHALCPLSLSLSLRHGVSLSLRRLSVCLFVGWDWTGAVGCSLCCAWPSPHAATRECREGEQSDGTAMGEASLYEIIFLLHSHNQTMTTVGPREQWAGRSN